MNTDLHEKYEVVELWRQLHRMMDLSGTSSRPGEMTFSGRHLISDAETDISYFIDHGHRLTAVFLLRLGLVEILEGDEDCFNAAVEQIIGKAKLQDYIRS